jgi:ATP-grasp ribosomal peptide maturase
VGLVLIVSACGDWSAERVAEALDTRGAAYRWLDPAEFPQRLSLAARFDGDWRTSLVNSDQVVDLVEVFSVFYWRPGDFIMPAGMSGPELRFARAQARVALGGLLTSLPVRWMNHPSALADHEYKPRQLAAASRCGLVTPRTVITNDPKVLRQFADEVGDVVVKTLAEPIVAEAGTHTTVWTRRLTHADLDDLVGVETTAHMVQEFVAKSHDVRVTAVGDRHFAVAITAGSEASHVDWRADYDALSYRVVDCPQQVATGIDAYLAATGLTYGAFDFAVRADDGAWVFLETNAAGQWGWLAEECGLPVADAIADELTKGLP